MDAGGRAGDPAHPSAEVVSPGFLAPVIGAYRLSLVVKNSRNVPSLPSVTLVTVVDGTIEPPQVRVNDAAGASATVKTQGGVPVTLDASQSKAHTGGPLSCVWTQDTGTPVILDGASSPLASFTPVSAGTHVFSVEVVDSRSNQGTGSVMVLVGTDAPPGVSSGASGGDPGVVVETGGGGGGGGCEMRRIPAKADGSGPSLAWVALLWFALLIQRVVSRRRGI